jgi:hypothetical protein
MTKKPPTELAKRGRKPKYGETMSGASRVANFRARQAERRRTAKKHPTIVEEGSEVVIAEALVEAIRAKDTVTVTKLIAELTYRFPTKRRNHD